MVRVGSLHDRLLLKKDEIDPRSGMTTMEQLRAINKEIRRLTPRKNRAAAGIFKRVGRLWDFL